MTNATVALDTETYKIAEKLSKKSGFAYVGDYVTEIIWSGQKKAGETSKTNTERLDKLLEEGLNSGSVVADSKFWKSWQKRLGVRKVYKDEN